MSKKHFYTSLILLAGGKGLRMGYNKPKQFVLLRNKPLALYSFETFASMPEISEIIVVCNPKFQNLFQAPWKKIIFAEPGEQRQDSVFSGWKKVSQKIDLICIHDAARPLIDQKTIKELLHQGFLHGAAALGVPVTNTIKECSTQRNIKRSLNRETLWEMQTPQALLPKLMKQGFEYIKKNHISVTDDISLVESFHFPIKVVPGSKDNLKVTYPNDLKIAQALLEQ